jgi:hypothetical protein
MWRREKEPEALPDPEFSADPVFRRCFSDQYDGSHSGGLGGMTQREEDELLLMCGTRKQRKAIKARRKASEKARQTSS